MPDINLVRSHSVSIQEARARVQKAADELAVEHNLRSEWQGDTLRFYRSGLEGEIKVTASEIRLEATLSFLLKPLQAALVDRIERMFEKLFPEPTPGSQAKKPTRGTGPTAK